MSPSVPRILPVQNQGTRTLGEGPNRAVDSQVFLSQQADRRDGRRKDWTNSADSGILWLMLPSSTSDSTVPLHNTSSSTSQKVGEGSFPTSLGLWLPLRGFLHRMKKERLRPNGCMSRACPIPSFCDKMARVQHVYHSCSPPALPASRVALGCWRLGLGVVATRQGLLSCPAICWNQNAHQTEGAATCNCD